MATGKYWGIPQYLLFFFDALWRWGESNPRPKNAAFGVMRTENSGSPFNAFGSYAAKPCRIGSV